MAAYIIAELVVTNAEGYEGYRTQVGATIDQYGGTYVVRGGAIEAIEGDAPGRMVVLQFADVDAAKRWYNSQEYQAIVGQRQANSTGRLTLVEGVA
jgi:uncharacterized protein (DUF1330 family)